MLNDLISRQAAIDLLKQMRKDGNMVPWEGKDVFARIRRLPPAQPETKKGKWIRNDNGTYSCSVCHSWIPEEQHHYARYCLYCGADMRGENDV